jgi:hypothetical protein
LARWFHVGHSITGPWPCSCCFGPKSS